MKRRPHVPGTIGTVRLRGRHHGLQLKTCPVDRRGARGVRWPEPGEDAAHQRLVGWDAGGPNGDVGLDMAEGIDEAEVESEMATDIGTPKPVWG